MQPVSQLEEKIYTVSQLNQQARLLLDTSFPPLRIEGEISNLSRPSSGHWYFSLKDESAQIRCAMFRRANSALAFTPKDGMHVIALAKVSLYEARGDFQLIVEDLEESGDGKLQRAFLALKKQLQAEGLFAAEHKQPLPTLPQCIGVVTSPTGAAIRDILSVLKRRFASLPVIIYPTPVQGADAAPQIVAAIQRANQHNVCDVLILTRGGGSLEDLWPFNDEQVAHALFASQVTIISAVGHEIDFTIADFVADHRAATPSAAAEMVSPEGATWLNKMNQLEKRLDQLLTMQLQHARLKLEQLSKRLRHPGHLIQEQSQRIDDIESRLQLALKHYLRHCQQQLANLARALDAVSPLATLNRGYAIVRKEDHILRDCTAVSVGDNITAKLAKGELRCTVDEVLKAIAGEV